MHATHDVSLPPPHPWIRVFGTLGAAGLLLGLALSPGNAWAHLLLLGLFAVQLGLAGALLVAVQFLSGAGWSVALRRVPEALTALIPAGGALVLAVQVLRPELYPWTSPDYHPHGAFKHAWLDRGFFLARGAAYIVLWTWLARLLVTASRRQDCDQTLASTRRLAVLSAVFAVVYGVTGTLAAFDWVMSREPDWVSTIFGIYLFAGTFTTGLAATAIVSSWLRRQGPFRNVYSEAHRHDLGKLMFGMSSFWAYAWYCQYMLIWYVNLPEETTHYLTRQSGVLHPLFWANVVVNWAIPFAALLPRAFKVSDKILLNVSCVLMFGRGFDLFMALLPPTRARWEDFVLPAAMTLGAVAGGWALVRRSLVRHPLLPVGDPFLVESLPHGDGHVGAEGGTAR